MRIKYPNDMDMELFLREPWIMKQQFVEKVTDLYMYLEMCNKTQTTKRQGTHLSAFVLRVACRKSCNAQTITNFPFH